MKDETVKTRYVWLINCLFLSKVFIILLKKVKDGRRNFIEQKWRRSNWTTIH